MSNSPWWIFFPFVGLDIVDDDADLKHPLFGDATLVSRSHMPNIVEDVVRTRAQHTSDPDNQALVRDIYGSWTKHQEPFSSLIAVRKTGQLGSGKERKESTTKTLDAAADRAYEISALLSIVVLGHWLTWGTCGLVDQIHDRWRRRTFGFDTQQGNAYAGGTSRGNIYVLTADNDLKWSRAELRNLLERESFREFALCFQLKAKPAGYCELIRRAAVRLSGAIHSPDFGSQILGAVTTLELLLTKDGERQKVLHDRLFALFGEMPEDLWHAREVIDARNLFVHDAKKVEREDLVGHAIELALSALLRCADIGKQFNNKPAFLHYLDFVAIGLERYSVWSAADIRTFAALLRHDPDGYRLPWEHPDD